MMLRKGFRLFILSSLFTTGFPLINSTIASSSQAIQVAQTSSSDCTNALQAAKTRLQEGRDLTIRIEDRDMTRIYSDYPTGRPSAYMFVLDGPATASILHSPQMLTSISENIIDSCESVSAVKFVLNYSDWEETFGLVGDAVKKFSCQDFDLIPGRRRPSLVWGEVVCL